MEVKRGVFPPLSNNCYLILDEKSNQSALVDCSAFNESMEKLIGDSELKYILLTHGHYDHIGGVNKVKEKYGAQVVISKEDEKMLSSAVKSLAAFSADSFEKVTADFTVSDGDELTLGDIRIKVISTPGHTPGGVCFLAENALFTGDTLFCGSCGRTDFPGGSGREMVESLRRLAALDGDYNVYPGHEDVTTLDFERKNNYCLNM